MSKKCFNSILGNFLKFFGYTFFKHLVTLRMELTTFKGHRLYGTYFK